MLRRKSDRSEIAEEVARRDEFVWVMQGDGEMPWTSEARYWEELPEAVSVPAEGTFLVRNGKVLALDKEDDGE